MQACISTRANLLPNLHIHLKLYFALLNYFNFTCYKTL